jgi:hypothetical protein
MVITVMLNYVYSGTKAKPRSQTYLAGQNTVNASFHPHHPQLITENPIYPIPLLAKIKRT